MQSNLGNGKPALQYYCPRQSRQIQHGRRQYHRYRIPLTSILSHSWHSRLANPPGNYFRADTLKIAVQLFESARKEGGII